MYKNSDGYRDPTQGAAIRKADRPPAELVKAVQLMRYIADWCGFEVTGRIWLRDKTTGKIYK